MANQNDDHQKRVENSQSFFKNMHKFDLLGNHPIQAPLVLCNGFWLPVVTINWWPKAHFFEYREGDVTIATSPKSGNTTLKKT